MRPFRHQSVAAEVADRMRGRSLREPCPVSLDELAHVFVEHVDLDGAPRPGELIVHRALAAEVIEIFAELRSELYPIACIRLIDEYDGDDDRSMADNNTSAFNCRPNLSRPHLQSRHSFGCAIDVNPLFNPYVRSGDGALRVLPPAAAPYVRRDPPSPGMIVPGDACHRAFTRRGWTWGGSWTARIDYQHFEKKPPAP